MFLLDLLEVINLIKQYIKKKSFITAINSLDNIKIIFILLKIF